MSNSNEDLPRLPPASTSPVHEQAQAQHVTDATPSYPDPPEEAPPAPTPAPAAAAAAAAAAPAAVDQAAAQEAVQSGLSQLFGAFMSSVRNGIAGLGTAAPAPDQQAQDQAQAQAQAQSQNASTPETAATSGAATATVAAAAAPTAQSTSSDPSSNSTETSAAQSTSERQGEGAPSVLYFRLPFNGPDGNPALLAFHPMPLPAQANAPSSVPNTTPHPAGHVPRAPLFVPFGASPLPFSFIYDAPTNTAWPIAQVVPGTPPGGPAADMPGGAAPQLVAGPPFRIILDFHFTPAPEPERERADPAKAAAFVDTLEKADAELRSRMARLGLGDIAAGGEEELGCGVCLDSYAPEDRPDWIAGKAAQDEAVVAVPCDGHHTLHKACLRDWLAKTPQSQWTCPFCRASLAKHPHRTRTHTLRDEVRARERANGWRCDAPACLPRYPEDAAAVPAPTQLVKLTPCRHEVHLDCLCTAMRVQDATAAPLETDDEEHETTGKWVECPTCRKESWAQLPLARCPRRPPLSQKHSMTSIHEQAPQQAPQLQPEAQGKAQDEEQQVEAMLSRV